MHIRNRTMVYVLLAVGAVVASLFVFLQLPTDPSPSPRTPNASPPQPQRPSPGADPDPPAPGEGPEQLHRRLEIADLVSIFPDDVTRRGPADQPLVALTFDDGPDATFTPRILDVLAAEKVRATFFINGVRAERWPDVTRRLVREGHVLANHGYGHIRYSAATEAQIRQDLDRNAEIIRRFAGADAAGARLFRPPYGALDLLAAQVVIDAGYHIVLWTLDTRDWMGRSAEEIVAAVRDEVVNGAIILQHSAVGGDVGLEGTVQALPTIIRDLRQRGFSFVTVPELLALLHEAPVGGGSRP